MIPRLLFGLLVLLSSSASVAIVGTRTLAQRVRIRHHRLLPLWASAADGGEEVPPPPNRSGKGKKNDGDNSDTPRKLPPAMIKPSNDAAQFDAPPQNFDSGVGSKNKPSQSARRASLLAELGAADAAAGGQVAALPGVLILMFAHPY